MKCPLLLISVLFVFIGYVYTRNNIINKDLGEPPSTNISRAEYHRILPNNRVIFRVKVTDAQEHVVLVPK